MALAKPGQSITHTVQKNTKARCTMALWAGLGGAGVSSWGWGDQGWEEHQRGPRTGGPDHRSGKQPLAPDPGRRAAQGRAPAPYALGPHRLWPPQRHASSQEAPCCPIDAGSPMGFLTQRFQWIQVDGRLSWTFPAGTSGPQPSPRARSLTQAPQATFSLFKGTAVGQSPQLAVGRVRLQDSECLVFVTVHPL